MDSTLPVDAIQEDYLAALKKGHVVVSAATGSGKSTRLPLWSRARGRVLVVEPGRVACTALAEYVAQLAESELGEEVGYAIRFEQQCNERTGVIFATPGIALRWLEADGLAGFDTVILDEFHQRRWDTDLLVALLKAKGQHRLVMTSATLAAERLAAYLPGESLHAEGRSYPVDLAYRDGGDRRAMPSLSGLEKRVAAAVREALERDEGDVLVFLPGRGEIRACEKALSGVSARVLALHASAPKEQQQAALQADGAGRRVILATNVAETSLTIPAVTTVVDSGLERRTGQRNGRTVLTVAAISRANAEQRRGRAGRVAPGLCIRLWGDLAPLEEFTPPEVQREQLLELVLAAAAAGHRVEALEFPDTLPEAAVDRAREQLRSMAALDEQGAITRHGRALFSLPIDSFFAHLISAMPDAKTRGAMVDLAAALGARSALLRLPREEVGRKRLQEWEPSSCDAWTQVAALRRQPPEELGGNPGARREARRVARRIREALDLGEIPEQMDFDREAWVEAMLRASPERVFVRREKRPQAMGNGQMEVSIAEDSRMEGDAQAAVVLDEHSVPAKKGTRNTITMATCLAPVRLQALCEAGLGETRMGEVRLEEGRPLILRERVYANRVIDRQERVPEGSDLRAALAELILAGRCLAPAGRELQHDLRQWGLYRELGHGDGEVPEARAWLEQRLEALGVDQPDDLELVEVEDLRFPGIPEWEREEFERRYPREISLHDLKMTAEYQPRRKRVVLEHQEGTRRAEPKRWELPSWQGWRVVYKRGSRVVDVR